jgi:hypothetical protein
LIASEKPLRPSTDAIRISLTVKTSIQNLEP